MKRKIISILTLLAMCITILPGALWADGIGDGAAASETTVGTYTIYVPEKAVVPTGVGATTTVTAVTDTTTAWTSGWYIVPAGEMNIDHRITVTGDVHLILAEGARLNAKAGITVEGANKLTIWEQAKDTGGTLTATSTDNVSAGIGGSAGKDGGTLTFNGGKVIGKSVSTWEEINDANVFIVGSYGAGIGGGGSMKESGGSGGTILVNGGSVTGICETDKNKPGAAVGAGIGGGGCFSSSKSTAGCIGGHGGTLTINGGCVTGTCDGKGSSDYLSYKEASGAGIGGGGGNTDSIGEATGGNGGMVTINGGVVQGTCQGNRGKNLAAGIGGGASDQDNAPGGHGGILIINGGEVTGNGNAGIGGGLRGDGGSITINDGTVEGTGDAGAGIGGGSKGNGGKITIHGGKVTGVCTVIDTECIGAGIGGGTDGNGGTITITGGTVKGRCTCSWDGFEEAASKGAGIGGGKDGSSGTILITCGTVEGSCASEGNSIKKNHGAGIGSGAGMADAGGSITITGGTVTGTCGSEAIEKYGAGIGGGCNNAGGSIIITGGSVYADGGTGIGIGKPEIKDDEVPQGSFSTTAEGSPGHAVIFASGEPAISDRGADATLSGVIFENDEVGKVYGNPTIQTDATIPSGKALVVEQGHTLTLDAPVTLTNKGTITNQGTIRCIGKINNLDGTTDNTHGTIQMDAAGLLTFQVVNGHWADGTEQAIKTPVFGKEAEQTQFVREAFSGKDLDTTFKKALLPTGMQPNEGYEGGAWQPEPKLGEKVTKDMTYTYSFTEIPPYVPPANPGKTETTENPDGSTTTVVTKPDGTKTTTTEQPNGDKVSETKKPDGTTIATEEKANGDKKTETKKPDGTQIVEKENAQGDTSKEVRQPDGSGTIDISKADGSQSTTTIDKNGQQATQAVVSDKAVEEAVKANKPVITPTPAKEAADVDEGESAPVLNITVPKTVTKEQPLTIVVPVEDLEPSDVLVVVHPDGKEEIVRKSIGTEDGIKMQITGDVQLKVIKNEQTFTDTEDHWAENAIENVTARGIFNGVGNEQFAPNVTTNRAMLVTVLHNLESNPEQSFDGDFNDVADDAWYAESVKWAAQNGIVSGVGNNNFAPEDTLTREQMVTMLYRYAGSPKVEGNAAGQFSDSDQISGYARDAMNWAISKGIVNGVGNNTLAPQGQATRAQLAIVITKLMQL